MSVWCQKRNSFMLAEGDFRLLRPIAVEHDPDHDHRACRDHMREAPACHTHSETPFSPSSDGLTVNRPGVPTPIGELSY